MPRELVASVPSLAHAVGGRGQVVQVQVELIDVVDRLREIDWDWAAALWPSIQREGLQNPIEVMPTGERFRLVVGAHRWAAHQVGQAEFIDAFVVTSDWATARAREISENLYRRELSALDRAAFIAELYEVERARSGLEPGESAKRLGAEKRWAKDASANLAQASGLADSVAEKVGLSRRAIFRDLALHKALAPELARALIERGEGETPAATLRSLSKLSPDQQRKIAEGLRSEKPLKSAWAKVAPKPVAAPDEKRSNAFHGAWSRMGTAERKRALGLLVAQLTPGERRELDRLLDKRGGGNA